MASEGPASPARRPLILDGGLATTLEARGHRLDRDLWSAGVFLREPQAVEAVHRAFLEAGADILTSASYQMSFEGLARAGLDRRSAAAAMRETVAVARRAQAQRQPRALVAASLGPYGAVLGTGAEYRGRYGLGVDELVAFHRDRLDVLCDSGADLLAVETIPSLEETRALVELLEGRAVRAWVSFSCRDGTRLADGREIARAAALLDPCDAIIAVGVNCTAPEHVGSLMDEIRSATAKPIVVYPNSGESWDAGRRRWSGEADAEGFCRLARGWAARGAWAIGGCCRIGPDVIRQLATTLSAPRAG
jgi:homocysteine S-methyltransferase